MLLAIHASLHPRAANLQPLGVSLLAGKSVPIWSFDATAAQGAWDVTFDRALAKLEAVPRMYTEPDGSWLLVSAVGETPRWQMEGNLYDGGEQLAYCDLKGTCPMATWESLLRCFGWPEQAVLLQLTKEAVFLEEADFRQVFAA